MNSTKHKCSKIKWKILTLKNVLLLAVRYSNWSLKPYRCLAAGKRTTRSWSFQPNGRLNYEDASDFLRIKSHYRFYVFTLQKSETEEEVSADFKTTTNSKTRRVLSQKRCKYLSLVLVCDKAPLYAQWNCELALKRYQIKISNFFSRFGSFENKLTKFELYQANNDKCVNQSKRLTPLLLWSSN